MSNSIVQLNVTQTVAPTPPSLQKTGAFLSQGATITAPGTKTLLTQLSSLSTSLAGAKAVTGIAQTSGVATVTTTLAHGFTIGDSLYITVSGATPAAYNGSFLCTVTTTTAFTYLVPSGTTSPATGSSIVYTMEDVAELVAMNATFFSQGSNQAVYVLELGAGNVNDGVTYLTNWIAQNPGVFYSYLVPRTWDATPSYLAFLAGFQNNTAKTYFHTTTTLATYQNYSALMKDVMAYIECPQYGSWAANALTAISYAAAWPANVLTEISWSPSTLTVTATTTTAHGVAVGNTFTISGVTPAAYNGTFVALSGTTGSTLVYGLATNPGTETVLGTLVASTGGLVTATTTTAHGVAVGDYFTIAGVTPIGYNGTFRALTGTTGSTIVYAAPTALGAETVLGTLVASVYSSSGIPSTEFSAASYFYASLNYKPSTSNKVTPAAFTFLYGVTPFPTQGNSSLLSTLKTAKINIVGTGAEGGISNTILLWGTTMDGRQFTYWYSVDWAQINTDLDVSNAVINGSNNPANPLYYNQPGINTLQQVAASTMSDAISFGMAAGTVIQTAYTGTELQNALNNGTFSNQIVVNAVPFITYLTENPDDYATGTYDGFTIIYITQNGFISLLFNLNVTDFVATS